MLAIWSLVPLPFLKPGWTSGRYHMLLKPGLKNFEHYFTSMWDEYYCVVLEQSLALPFFGIGMKTDLFHSFGQCWVFQFCWHTKRNTFTAPSFRILNTSTGIPSLPLALFILMLPKVNLTSHSRMSRYMCDHTIVVIWVTETFFFFFCSFYMYSCHLLIYFASVGSILFLSFIVPIFV